MASSRNALEQALMDEIKQWTGTARENNVLGDNLELLRDSGSPGAIEDNPYLIKHA